MIGIVVVILLLTAGVILIGWRISAPVYKGAPSGHFVNGRFINPTGTKAKDFTAVFKWMLSRNKGPWTKNYETEIGPKPIHLSQDLIVTFVNHSTFLIQWNMLNILTDPIWSKRCSPFTFMGPQRMRPPGIRFEDLPHIDLVLISHNHYDHLDLKTVLELEENFSPVFIVPLGVKQYLKELGVRNLIELDWGQFANAGLIIKAMPAQHFSGRGMFDRDQTLWTGYLLEHDERKLYFVGDTGYGEFFKEIGKKEGPIDVALIPIGAYKPEWFMSPIHVNPAQAIQIHKDIRSKQSVAMHFGTFPLADEGSGKAEEELILELDKQNIKQMVFRIPEEGQPMKL